MKDKIKGTYDYLTALVKKAERILYSAKTREYCDFNEACEAEFEAEKELKDAKKERFIRDINAGHLHIAKKY